MYVCQASWSTTGNYPIYILTNGLHVVLNIPFKTLCRLSAGEFSFKRCLWTKETEAGDAESLSHPAELRVQ